MIDKQHDSLPTAGIRIIASIDVGAGAEQVAEAACTLSEALGCNWEAVHIESPSNAGLDQTAIADALGFAASLGATIATFPAASVAAGLKSHIEAVCADHVVVAQSQSFRGLFRRHALIDDLNGRLSGVTLHLIPVADQAAHAGSSSPEHSSMTHYVYALLGVFMTVGAALALNRYAGIQNLSFVFFLPVIAAAARLGTKPALFAAVVCSAAFNFFFLAPVLMLKPSAIQSWIMLSALILVALYTGRITENLRTRAVLSERSAQENARIATFVAELTRAADWETTSQAICSGISALLDVQSLLIREVDGTLTTVASVPAGISLDPLDKAALDWAWTHGEPAGFGAGTLSAVNWRFEPLSTSLGTLAVVALARTDGRNPVPTTRKLMLSTLLAQCALALERLRLEDLMKSQALGPK